MTQVTSSCLQRQIRSAFPAIRRKLALICRGSLYLLSPRLTRARACSPAELQLSHSL